MPGNRFFLFLVIAVLCALPLHAEEFQVTAAEVHADPATGLVTATGHVRVTGPDLTLYADRVTLDKKQRIVTAQGHVRTRLNQTDASGDRLVYRAADGTATIFMGRLDLPDDVIFRADEIHFLGDDRFYLVNAAMTTCPDCCDRWSFDSKQLRVRKEGYAVFRSLGLRIGKHHWFYLPGFIYPAKTGRAFGLLIPEIGNSSRQGFKYRQELFIPLGPSMDLTPMVDYYSKAGTGTGLEFRIARVPGEFGRFTAYSIHDDLKDRRRSLLDAAYERVWSGGARFRLRAFEGDDFDLVRDFTFHQYDLAARSFYTDATFSWDRPRFHLSIGAQRRNLRFEDGEFTATHTPEVHLASRALTFAGHQLELAASAAMVNNPRIDPDDFLSARASVELYRTTALGAFRLTDTVKLGYRAYGDNPMLVDAATVQGELKLMAPELLKETASGSRHLQLFAALGYAGASAGLPLVFDSADDLLWSDGPYLSAGMETVIRTGSRVVLGGIRATRLLNDARYPNLYGNGETAGTLPVTGYLRLPLGDWLMSFDLRYDPTLNDMDRALISVSRGSDLYLAYLRAFTYGEGDSRDSLIASWATPLTEHWSMRLRTDYDFTLDDFRYRELSFRWYRDCIGFAVAYRNNSYSATTTNEFTISLILRNIGNVIKYRLGL